METGNTYLRYDTSLSIPTKTHHPHKNSPHYVEEELRRPSPNLKHLTKVRNTAYDGMDSEDSRNTSAKVAGSSIFLSPPHQEKAISAFRQAPPFFPSCSTAEKIQKNKLNAEK